MPQVEVTFDIDANGILNVNARDKATGKEQKITISASTNLSKQDVERLVGEGERNAAEDRRRRELAEARNQADNLIYQAEKSLQGLDGSLPAPDRTRIEGHITELRQAINGDDLSRLQQLSEALQQATAALSQQAGARQAQPAGGPQDGDTVEGQYREILIAQEASSGPV